MVINYATTVAVLIRPLVDFLNYNSYNKLAAIETYVNFKGAKSYVCSSQYYLIKNEHQQTDFSYKTFFPILLAVHILSH